jgi:hypothetical protein
MFVEWVIFVKRKELLGFNSQRVSLVLNFVIDPCESGMALVIGLTYDVAGYCVFKALKCQFIKSTILRWVLKISFFVNLFFADALFVLFWHLFPIFFLKYDHI